MPIDIEYKKDNIGVITHAVGVVTLDDVIESSKCLFSYENFKNLRYWIVLRENCSAYIVSLSDMKEVFSIHGEAAKLNPDLNVALVPNSESQFIRDQLYESHMYLIRGFNTRVFGGRESAEHWIGKAVVCNGL